MKPKNQNPKPGQKIRTKNDMIIKKFPGLLKKSVLISAFGGKIVSQNTNYGRSELLLVRVWEGKDRLFREGIIRRKRRHNSIFKRNIFYCPGLGGLKPPALAGSFSVSSLRRRLPVVPLGIADQLSPKESQMTEYLHGSHSVFSKNNIGVGICGPEDIFAVRAEMSLTK
ncbi:MAG: hypothetical protein LBP22_02680 [Deltaproteobacteria bacterium]|jgi:hypothetical protein|nr:hypothetical protein [Deltaproteobacteria bacterium]